MKEKTTAIILAWIFWPALDFYLGRPVKGIFKLLTIGGLVLRQPWNQKGKGGEVWSGRPGC